MEFDIKLESAKYGDKFHWIVRCFEGDRFVELHRFYLSLENQIFHRGPHGEHERAALEAFKQHLEAHPEMKQKTPERPRNVFPEEAKAEKE
jgi:hypothetical protein